MTVETSYNKKTIPLPVTPVSPLGPGGPSSPLSPLGPLKSCRALGNPLSISLRFNSTFYMIK